MSEAVVGRITMSKGPNNSLYFSMMPLQNECDRLREENKKFRAALERVADDLDYSIDRRPESYSDVSIETYNLVKSVIKKEGAK